MIARRIMLFWERGLSPLPHFKGRRLVGQRRKAAMLQPTILSPLSAVHQIRMRRVGAVNVCTAVGVRRAVGYQPAVTFTATGMRRVTVIHVRLLRLHRSTITNAVLAAATAFLAAYIVPHTRHERPNLWAARAGAAVHFAAAVSGWIVVQHRGLTRRLWQFPDYNLNSIWLSI